MTYFKQLFLFSFAIILFSCGGQGSKSENGATDGTSSIADSSQIKTVQEAYIYGIPLVLMDITRRQSADPSSELYSKPNQFKHNDDFPDASFKDVVRPNADTYYSIAWLDLSESPVVLSVPNTHGRYYMMPMMDAFSNVFASPGTRTTGNDAGKFLVTGPEWKGEVPGEMKQIQSPTNTVWIIGRIQVNSREDGAKVVVPLQKQFKLYPLSAPANGTAKADGADTVVLKGDPNRIIKNMPIEDYFNYVNRIMVKNSPLPADKAVIEKFAAIGVGPGKKFDLDAFPETSRTAIQNIPNQVFSAFESNIASGAKLVNGWNTGYTVIGTYGTDYLSRAVVAFFGLGANLREDAIYPSLSFDADNKQLNGANKYVLHFEKANIPPARAFWSLTMYNTEGYFIDNPINRYTIGDRSNLKANADGSIDIYLQKENPGKDKESNWLPSPAGDFNLLMRVYWPKQEMLDGKWMPPAVKKIAN